VIYKLLLSNGLVTKIKVREIGLVWKGVLLRYESFNIHFLNIEFVIYLGIVSCWSVRVLQALPPILSKGMYELIEAVVLFN